MLGCVFSLGQVNSPQIIPPTIPNPIIGLNAFVINASGKLNIEPTSKPFNQPAIGNSILNIMKPMAKRLMKEAIIAFFLSSNSIKNIGIIEAIPNANPAIKP
ncbi:MAG: hypothetical protein KDC67_17745, partial [Ignavibacteriae bacterium]|nr:hypothetical protein [Ignavibacteriota bacterium]